MGRGLRNDLRGTAAFGDREVKSTNETGQEGMIRWGIPESMIFLEVKGSKYFENEGARPSAERSSKMTTEN